MAGALVSASTGALESVLCKLSSVLETGYRRSQRVEKDVLFLRTELGSMHAAMQKHADMASKEQQDDPQVRAWVREVRELAYDIEDAVDAFVAEAEAKPGQGQQPAGVVGFVMSSVRRLRELLLASSGAGVAQEIEELKRQVVEVSDRRKRYKVDDHARCHAPTTGGSEIDPRLTALYAEIGGLVGVDAPVNRVVRLLGEDGGEPAGRKEEQGIKLVSVVGSGGLGKTTLASQVYRRIKGRFDCACFVVVSQRPNVKRILVDLLSGLGPACNMWDDEVQLIDRTRDFLHDKRFLIVFDDIWSLSAWEILRCVLPETRLGSRVITTTRTLDVAASCRSTFHGSTVFPIQPLNSDDSTKLFCRRIFHSDNRCPAHLKPLANALLRKCGGLPLAILHVSSLLATKPDSREAWESVLDSVGSSSRSLPGVNRILLLSFLDLPPHLRTCLLYLSVYPEDYRIYASGLIRRWVAEGFVAPERGGRRVDQVAQGYVNDLVNRSMVSPVDIGHDGQVQSFQVHDLVLSVLRSVSEEENFVTVVDGQQRSSLPRKIRRVSFHFVNGSEDVLLTGRSGSLGNQSSVRSLLIFGFTKTVLPGMPHLRALRVLDLGYCDWLENRHVECVSNMLQLRYLVLHSKFITKLPEGIGNLQHLQTLNVRYCPLQELPKTVAELRNLVWLYASGVKIPIGIEKMQCLEELSCVRVSSSCIDSSIAELGLLRKLRCLHVSVDDPCEMEDRGRRYREALLSSLYQLGRHSLESLSLDYRGHEEFILGSSMGSCFAPGRLRKLVIDKPLSRVPTWMSTLVNLTYVGLYISRMDANDIIVLKGIPSLSFLRLVFTGRANGAGIVFDDQGFRYVKELQVMCFVAGMWPMFAPGAMPRLQRYHLTLKLRGARSECDDFDFGLERLANLQHVNVEIVPDSASNVDAKVAEAAIRGAASLHRNQPTVEIGTCW